MLAPESTTISLSSGFMADGTGQLHSLVGEKKVALFVSSSFEISTHLRGRIALVFQSLPEIHPQFTWRRDCADEEF